MSAYYAFNFSFVLGPSFSFSVAAPIPAGDLTMQSPQPLQHPAGYLSPPPPRSSSPPHPCTLAAPIPAGNLTMHSTPSPPPPSCISSDDVLMVRDSVCEIEKEMERIEREVGVERFRQGMYREACKVYTRQCTAAVLDDFLTLDVYNLIVVHHPMTPSKI